MLKSPARILHYPGRKWSMAEWIISQMSAHTTYLKQFFGSIQQRRRLNNYHGKYKKTLAMRVR